MTFLEIRSIAYNTFKNDKDEEKMFKPKKRDEAEIAQDILVREVTEDVHKEQLEKMWRRYRMPLAAVIILVLLAVIGMESYKTWRTNVRLAESDIYEQAAILNAKGQADEALAVYARLQNGKTPYKYLAELRKAGILFEQGKNELALGTLDALRQNSNAPQELRAVAAIGYVSHQVDTGNPEKLQNILNSYMMPGNVWYGTATELSTLLLIREGKVEAAKKMLADSLASQNIPQSVHDRLRALQIVLEK